MSTKEALLRGVLDSLEDDAFLESPNLAGVVHLSLYDTDFSPKMKVARKKRFGERVKR